MLCLEFGSYDPNQSRVRGHIENATADTPEVIYLHVYGMDREAYRFFDDADIAEACGELLRYAHKWEDDIPIPPKAFSFRTWEDRFPA